MVEFEPALLDQATNNFHALFLALNAPPYSNSELVSLNENVLEIIGQFRDFCQEKGLIDSFLNADLAYKTIAGTQLSQRSLADEITKIFAFLQRELMTKVFLQLTPEEAHYYNMQGMGGEITSKLPEEDKEFIEAAKCFATMRYTATVFHLTRAIESLVDRFGVMLSIAVENRQWDSVLNDIDAEIKKRSNPIGRKLTEADKKELAQYSEAALSLRHVKNAWRNPVSHGESFRDFEARNIFQLLTIFTQSFVKLLNLSES